MPKKFGTNTKKEEAKEKESIKKKEKKEEEIRVADDSFWKETDDKVNKKLQKEKEQERKKQETLKRKQENKELVEKELEELQQTTPTRREIEDHKERTLKRLLQQHQESKKEEEVEEIDIDKEFVNPNLIQKEKINDRGIEVIDVSGVEESLEVLTMNEYDKHPEKRMKAAWNAYFEKQLPIYKAEYPSFKRNQLINIIQKDFKKSTDNPVYKQQLIATKQKIEI